MTPNAELVLKTMYDAVIKSPSQNPDLVGFPQNWDGYQTLGLNGQELRTAIGELKALGYVIPFTVFNDKLTANGYSTGSQI